LDLTLDLGLLSDFRRLAISHLRIVAAVGETPRTKRRAPQRAGSGGELIALGSGSGKIQPMGGFAAEEVSMYLRIVVAGLLAALLVVVGGGISTLAPSDALAQTEAKDKAKQTKTRKPTAKQLAARELTKKCNADWREHRKTAKSKNRAAYNAFMKECRAKNKKP
jgi:hypothetical protein